MKPTLVIDSSIAFKWLVTKNEVNVKEADKILQDFISGKVKIIMPEIAKYEIGNALLRKGMDIDYMKIALNGFYALPLEFKNETAEFCKTTIEIAAKYNLSYYDASFITQAKLQKADLITENIKHQGKYKGTDIKVISLKDYK